MISKNCSNNLVERLFLRFQILILLSTAVDSPVRLDLYLKDVELVVLTLTGTPLLMLSSSLLNCDKLPEMSQYLLLYSVKLYIGIIISRLSALSTFIIYVSYAYCK